MSVGLISRSSDLSRLRNEGYEIEVSDGYLIISHIPYVNGQKQIGYGKLVSNLTIAGDKTTTPNDHVVMWTGEYPCNSKGSQLTALIADSTQNKIREDLVTNYRFSQKPQNGYPDYYEKMTTYASLLEGHARAIDSLVTSRTFPVVEAKEDESVFCYIDTASSRAGITSINDKLKNRRIAIVGLGGSGSYILDLVAKTPVAEIHLFDGDVFHQHNAFRSPGAPSIGDLKKVQKKVDWLVQNYSRMRRGIIPHSEKIGENNLAELKGMDFVFLSIDKGRARRMIVDYLIENKISFIDVGMGLFISNDMLDAQVRITGCTPADHDHIGRRVPFSDGEDEVYTSNIQVADLNALNAALAVIKWKKYWGFYLDAGKENYSLYHLSDNIVLNEEPSDEA